MSYITETHGLVYPYEIDGRIGEIIREIREADPSDDDGSERLREELQGELRELREFKDQVSGRIGGEWVSARIVAEADFVGYARDYAEELAGDQAEFLFGYVNWQAFADALINDYARVEDEDGNMYLVR